MSSWNDFLNDAGKVASKAAIKAGELTDAAAARIKLQSLKLHLCEEYERLGRLSYATIKRGDDRTTDTADAIAKIDSLRAEVKKLEDGIRERREARQAAADTAEPDADADSDESTDGDAPRPDTD